MGFYSTKTSEEKRVKQLTGDIHLSEEFKEEIKNRDIPIYQGYNIQKRLRFEVEQGQLKGDEVDSRLMELLEENSKNNVSNIYTQEIKKDSDSPNRIPPRPQTNEFKIPPRARDGKTFSTDLTQKEMLEKIIKQNQKIINQNKIIIEGTQLQEERADSFAISTMIPKNLWKELDNVDINEENLQIFSKKYKIPMSFIVGRLAKNKKIKYSSKIYQTYYKN